MEVVLVVQHQVRPQPYLCSKGAAGACWYPPGGGAGPTERSPAQAPALRHRELLGAAGSCRKQEMQLPEYPHTIKSSPWEGRRPGQPQAKPTGNGLGAAGSCWVPLGAVSSWKYAPSQHSVTSDALVLGFGVILYCLTARVYWHQLNLCSGLMSTLQLKLELLRADRSRFEQLCSTV